MRNFLVCMCCIVFTFQSCLKDDIGSSHPETFQYLWDVMDQNYGGFIPRKVDWDSVYAIYQPQAALCETEDELWDVCANMIDILDDQHVYMYRANPERGFSSGKEFDEILAEAEFEISIIKNNYIQDFTSILVDEEEVIYGKIKNENLGYIYFPHFSNDGTTWYEKIDEATSFLDDTDGLILDLRNNGGGAVLIDRYIAARFVAEEKFVFSIQTRNGPARTDFDEPTHYYSKPDGDQQYTKPTILLTNHSTVSGGEEVALFLQTQSHITVVGDSTSNAFATVDFARLLPNGWEFGYPNQLYSYPDGTSPEGIGIVPDLYLRNDSLNVQNGIDKVLEKGIELL